VLFFLNIFSKEGPGFFYCRPDISNLLILDSMPESPQNGYAINWNGRLEREPNQCWLEKAIANDWNGSSCLIMPTCMSLRVLRFYLSKLLLLTYSLVYLNFFKPPEGRKSCVQSAVKPCYNKSPMHHILPFAISRDSLLLQLGHWPTPSSFTRSKAV
jgi:hypothetical protein